MTHEEFPKPFADQGEKWQSRFPVVDGMQEIRLDTWQEFLDYVRVAHADAPALQYRGQADANWPVQSTLDRLESRPQIANDEGVIRLDDPLTVRIRRLRAFKTAAQGRRGPNPLDLSDDDWWVLGQHHGLATPILDWTMSPFVALFFAFEQSKVALEGGEFGEPKNRAVFAVSASWIHKKHTADDPAPRMFRPQRELSLRLPVQSGSLMKMPEGCILEEFVRWHFTDLNSEEEGNVRPILSKIIMPNKGRVACLKYLNKMNISRLTLFPDLDGAAIYVNAIQELGMDTALGHLPDRLCEDEPQERGAEGHA